MTVRLIEGQVPYTGGTAIEITADKVINLLLRSEDNLLQVNDDNELYCDLQLANGIAPTDDFPVGVTTGIVNANDGRPYNGLLLHYETTSGAYAQWLYSGDGHFYLDGGTGVFKKVYYADEVDALIQALHDSLATVAFTGDYNDLINKPTIGDGVLTIQKNGTTIDTFTANSTTNKTVNVTVPTALSDLTNDLVNDGNLTLKKNHTTIAEFSANDATNVIADFLIPDVINNVTTPDSSNALSAAMGKELQDQINNISSIGRFLSIWNCATGLPLTDPVNSPYQYHTGDYYIIGNVSLSTNYKPNGGTYTSGVPSTTIETATVDVGDMYVYDGLNWALRKTTGQTMPIDNVLSTTSTNAVENRVVTNALLGKADLVNLPVDGDLAGLDSNGNLTDSGIAPSDIVKTSGDQSISGTKTFTISPVVPNKTADATNTGTAIATEAQVYKKQDTLIAQTAYTSKGTSTKVPTITTNTLGQVTGITETSIDFPVTSVNGSTGAVTVETPNTKTFFLPTNRTSQAALDMAQDILDYQKAGKNPIVIYDGQTYDFWSDTGTKLVFRSADITTDILTGSNTRLVNHDLEINYTGTTISSIGLASGIFTEYLETDVDYTTPYTPLYNGSPATKKYVDDSITTNAILRAKMAWFQQPGTSDLYIGFDGYFNYEVTPTYNNYGIDINNNTLIPGMQYIVKINTGSTAYTLTLGSNITNPFNESLTLTANKTTYLVFLATDNSHLVLFSSRTEA